jgi:hypothetical protein
VVLAGQREQLDDLIGPVGLGERPPQLVGDGRRAVQRIAQREQQPLGRRERRGIAADRRGDLRRGQPGGGGEEPDVGAPFVLRAAPRAGPQDDDLALAQRDRPGIEQAAMPGGISPARSSAGAGS